MVFHLNYQTQPIHFFFVIFNFESLKYKLISYNNINNIQIDDVISNIVWTVSWYQMNLLSNDMLNVSLQVQDYHFYLDLVSHKFDLLW